MYHVYEITTGKVVEITDDYAVVQEWLRDAKYDFERIPDNG